MRVRTLLALPLLLLLFVPGAVKAQGKNVPPTVVVRVSSIDSLIEHVKFLASLAGQPDAARQIEGLIKAKIGDKGLEGVDSGRAFGFYGRIGKELEDVSGVVLLPIADEKAFLNLLENLKVPVVKGGDGIYTIKTGSPIDAYLRFANKYAYITAPTTTALETKNLVDPAKLLAAKPTNAFTLTIQLDQVPDVAKLLATAQAEQVLQDLQDKKIPGESDTERAFRIAALKEVAKVIASVLKDGAVLHAAVDLDKQSGDLAASFSMSGVANSELAAGIEAIGKNASLFAGLLKKDAVFNGLGHVKVPESVIKALGDVIDEAKVKALSNIQDPAKKQQADALFKVITPTLKAGDFDGATVVTPSGSNFTVLATFKVKEGDELGKTVRSLVSDTLKDLPPAAKDIIKLDAYTAGTTKIHQVQIPADGHAGNVLDMVLGDRNVYVAFRNDAVFVSAGKDGLQAIKDAVVVKASAASPMLYYEVDVARLAHFAPAAQAAKAKELFPNGSGGIVRFSVEGGAAITVRLSTKIAVLQFLGQMK